MYLVYVCTVSSHSQLIDATQQLLAQTHKACCHNARISQELTLTS